MWTRDENEFVINNYIELTKMCFQLLMKIWDSVYI